MRTSCPECGHEFDLVLGTRQESAVSCAKEFREYMDWYLASIEGMKRERYMDDRKYKMAIRAGYSQFGRAAKDILAFVGGESAKAREGTTAIGLWLQSNNLPWNAYTVAKWINEWARNPEGFAKNGKH